ncbi:MAG: MBL fold metallo-hydrolase [Erysipelotrichaceae bacterium]|nr:MBL fold metallo-hydrolase [Erysipelotrichaceae bacterium]
MSEIRIIPIGSGSTGNCFYIEIGGYRFLIDMGIGYKKVRDALTMHDCCLEEVDGIFVTHGHYDHVKAAIPISNHVRCKVYANKSVMYSIRECKAERMVLNMYEDIGLFPGLTVRMFKVPHDFAYTCGYTFAAADRKIAYVTDCGRMNDRILQELAGADVTIIESNHDVEMLKNGPYPRQLQARIRSEAGHLSNDECAEAIAFLKEKGTSHFLLAHLSLQNNTPEIAFETVRKRISDPDIDLYVCPAEGNNLLIY